MARTGRRTLPIIYTPLHQPHVPRIELSYNIVVDHPEVPERVDVMAKALQQAGHADSFVEPREYPVGLAAAVHDETLMQFLEQATGRLAETDGESLLETPYTISPDTPLAANTLQKAWLASCVVLTGAELLREGAQCAYALERPPGHHAGRYKYGGYCYINHAAVAAHTLKAHGRVAVLDIDFHHGNGTQEIFYETDEVLYVSLHGHPAWAYPRFSGWPEETGTGGGEGFNLNLPLPMFTDNTAFLEAFAQALEKIAWFTPNYLILSSGFDTRAGDPVGAFSLTDECYQAIGEQLAALSVPILAVQEGGYDLEGLGKAVVALVEGLAQS
ncbi:MAG: histone deacetylase family protein [Chloroflexota bacterium]|nr:histone deacetylase family protein [Chloroflexota bacterium]MDE2839026.1 histone deacetylase family protein [Chloroflexota bacterium]MDE2931642.1 histone deacetylase family protein [Chloroflexota bacterium]